MFLLYVYLSLSYENLFMYLININLLHMNSVTLYSKLFSQCDIFTNIHLF